MINLEPINQRKLFGLDMYLLELIRQYELDIYPNKLLISGLKGIGKSTLAYHFINYVLTKDEKHKYDLKKFEIQSDNSTFKTILNKSNINLVTIDVLKDKKSIDINQIRDLIKSLNKSSFNNKPRFILIDNIDHLNINSINALLKILEEPNKGINFILIHNNKKVLPTLLSRCINFKVNLSNKNCLDISEILCNDKLENLINLDLINYYFTPGNIYYLLKFSEQHNYNLLELDLKNFLKILIKEKHYFKDAIMRYMIFDFMEFYFIKLNKFFLFKISDKYSYFLKRISDTKIYNLDEESLFIEFEEKILNG